ncbi:hypothetical protein F5884DRAFT_811356 [Xylogone sp. PMI_703]|nr:hypothetical protein F5884DRAFT_811356 [Xylogone sp. PMI_703]
MSSYTEVSPGTFKRECDGEEKVYRAMALAFNKLGKEHWCLYCLCALRFGPSFTGASSIVDTLRQAWKALRFEYPGLSVVPEGFTTFYVLPDANKVEDWASQTFFVESTRFADEIIASYTPRDLPSLYYLAASSEILFLSSHWRIDAIGTLMLLDRFFSILAQPPKLEAIPWTSEIQNLSPSMEDAVGPPEPTSPAMEELARSTIETFHKSTLNNCGLPYKGDLTTMPTVSTRSAVVFSKESTSAFVTACKAHNISVTAAIHAALAETVFGLSLEDKKDYSTVMSVNLRQYLQLPYRTQAHACQTYVSSIAPTVLRNSTFSKRTAALMDDYNNWHTDEHMKSLRLLYKHHAAAILDRKGPPPAPPSGVFLSSLGVVEQYLGGDYGNAIHVENFRFGVTMMTRQMLLYPWTFKGQLNLSVNYNEAYYDDVAARDVLNRVQTVLETELGVKLEKAAAA